MKFYNNNNYYYLLLYNNIQTMIFGIQVIDIFNNLIWYDMWYDIICYDDFFLHLFNKNWGKKSIKNTNLKKLRVAENVVHKKKSNKGRFAFSQIGMMNRELYDELQMFGYYYIRQSIKLI